MRNSSPIFAAARIGWACVLLAAAPAARAFDSEATARLAECFAPEAPYPCKLEAVRQAIDAGADVNAHVFWNPGHYRLITAAVLRGELEGVRLLLARGADGNAVNGIADSPGGHCTPLMYAVCPVAHQRLFTGCRVGSLEMVRLLCEAKVDLDKTPGWGMTPLEAAVTSGQPEITEALLRHGADPDKAKGREPYFRIAGETRYYSVAVAMDRYEPLSAVKASKRVQAVRSSHGSQEDGATLVARGERTLKVLNDFPLAKEIRAGLAQAGAAAPDGVVSLVCDYVGGPAGASDSKAAGAGPGEERKNAAADRIPGAGEAGAEVD